jgi:hypothetical protein
MPIVLIALASEVRIETSSSAILKSSLYIRIRERRRAFIKFHKNSCFRETVFSRRKFFLNFCDMFRERNFVVSLTDISWNHCILSTLIKLRINLSTLADCLHLLDGSFVCLSTLIITVTFTFHTTEYKNPTVSIYNNNHIYTKKY